MIYSAENNETERFNGNLPEFFPVLQKKDVNNMLCKYENMNMSSHIRNILLCNKLIIIILTHSLNRQTNILIN